MKHRASSEPGTRLQVTHTLVNGQSSDFVSVTDRAFNYGDGVFETVLVRNGQLCLWQLHKERLANACRVLGIHFSRQQELDEEADELCKRTCRQDAVLKIVVSRGGCRRGYRPEGHVEANRTLRLEPLFANDQNRKKGISLCVCRQRLMDVAKPLLGIKHLGRLEQVMARAEWGQEYQEGLMLDVDGFVVEGTMSNVFLLHGKQLLTPRIDRCGILGVMRRYLLENAAGAGLDVSETKLVLEDFLKSDCVFVCNAIIGLWPVKKLGEREWHFPEAFRKIQKMVDNRQ